jgi:hypothetical protein
MECVESKIVVPLAWKSLIRSQNHQVRPTDHSTCELHALLFATAQAPEYGSRLLLAELETIEEFGGGNRVLIESCHVRESLSGCRGRPHAALLQHYPNTGTMCGVGLPWILAQDTDRAGVRHLQTRDDLQGCGLASTVGPKDSRDLT